MAHGDDDRVIPFDELNPEWLHKHCATTGYELYQEFIRLQCRNKQANGCPPCPYQDIDMGFLCFYAHMCMLSICIPDLIER